jgi:hypothetical protein
VNRAHQNAYIPNPIAAHQFKTGTGVDANVSLNGFIEPEIIATSGVIKDSFGS